MLNVQKYLRENSLESLLADYKLNVRHHDTLPLVILNYDQIESPRNHPISNECRGLILEKDTWNVVARAFPRFFNLGEYRDIDSSFVWEDSFSQDKEDGSLMTLFQYNGVYYCCTRGSFADQPVNVGCQSWSYYFWAGLRPEGVDEVLRYNNYTLVFEFCSPYNKVVRYYKEPQLFLLTAYDNDSLRELEKEAVDEFAGRLSVARPRPHYFSCINTLKEFVEREAKSDHTYEGIVVRDINGLRLKIKSPLYLGLHRQKSSFLSLKPENFEHFLFENVDLEEFKVYFPEYYDKVIEWRQKINDFKQEIADLWEKYRNLPTKKDFALSVKYHPLSCVLFYLWDRGVDVETACDKYKKSFMNLIGV